MLVGAYRSHPAPKASAMELCVHGGKVAVIREPPDRSSTDFFWGGFTSHEQAGKYPSYGVAYPGYRVAHPGYGVKLPHTTGIEILDTWIIQTC